MNDAVVVGPLPTQRTFVRAPLYEPSNVTEPEPDAAASLDPELAAVLAAALAGAALPGAALVGAAAAAAPVEGAAAALVDTAALELGADDVALLWHAATVSNSATTPPAATRRWIAIFVSRARPRPSARG
jgi:hypothetical protein